MQRERLRRETRPPSRSTTGFLAGKARACWLREHAAAVVWLHMMRLQLLQLLQLLLKVLQALQLRAVAVVWAAARAHARANALVCVRAPHQTAPTRPATA